MKKWDNVPIVPGGIVDNVYFMQDEKAAVQTVCEFVILRARDRPPVTRFPPAGSSQMQDESCLHS
jgi:hypothetical protein